MMRYMLKVGILVLAVALASWSFAQDTPEAAIDAMAQEWIEAWNSGDMAAIAALYTENADLLGADGQMARGREEIETYLTELSSGPFAGTTLSVGEAEVQCVSETTCITDNSYEFAGDTSVSGLTTIVMTKQDDEWLIAAHRSRAPVPSAQ